MSQCKKDPAPTSIEPLPEFDETPYDLDYTGFTAPDFDDNPLTVEGVALGRMLFYEKKLSRDNSISCASCHRQEFGFSDPDRFSIGVDGSLGLRQAMSVFNTAWHKNEFFWDGRAHLLRDQALMPIEDQLEMKETLDNVILKLGKGKEYNYQFYRAFGDTNITTERIALALEQFMNSIVSNRSKYDDYLAGNAELTESEERGRQLYFAEYNPGFPETSGADCAHCHGGNNFDNQQYVNNGLDIEADQDDLGRELTTGDPQDRAKFKIPSLRNIAVTAPYMHDGRFTTLEQVIDHYDHGVKISPTLDPALEYTTYTGLMLTDQDKADLIAFLNTLTDEQLATDKRYSDPFE
ncbi:MAG: cytochrome c peroxidase [Salibacteraceae bacterium]